MAEQAQRRAPKSLVGSARPRIHPPTPARSSVRDIEQAAADLGIELYPWQKTAVRYLGATRPDGRWLYREVCAVVARQSGKTELLLPIIISRLRAGRRMIHTAQTREYPRAIHTRLSEFFAERPDELPRYRGRIVWPRGGAGSEEVRLGNGGHYRIVAPNGSSARGSSNDDVIVDEIRELVDFTFIAAAKPSLAASANPQIIYLSNAGEDDSAVLNALKRRADEDPMLAYLEWSAAPERAPDDRAGWAEANPSIGHNPGHLEYLEAEYRTNQLQGTLAIFETEHLCRWVSTMRERLVSEFDWAACHRETKGKPSRPVFGLSVDPDGRRASLAMAWRTGDAVSLRLLFDVTGNPIDLDRLGEDVKAAITRVSVGAQVAYDPLTDRELAKFAKKPKPVTGPEFANATAQFVNVIASGTLAWHEADGVGADLHWTARRELGNGTYAATRLQDDRPITAALAAIRAVWLASGPQPVSPRVM